MHEITPFEQLEEPVQMWAKLMSHHYPRAHQTFTTLLEQQIDPTMPCKFIAPLQVKEEGYLADYV